MSHEPTRPTDTRDDGREDDFDDEDFDDVDDADEFVDRPQPRPSIVCGVEWTEAAIESQVWLWEPYLAFGTLAVLDGDPGVGKSLLAIDLAARLSRALPLPDGRPCPLNPAKTREYVTTLFVNAEDDVHRTILPRIAAAGGDVGLAIFLGGVGECDRGVRLPEDLPLLEAAFAKFPGSLVVLDPLMALLSRSVPAGNDQAVREVLSPIAHAAADTGCCVLLVRHLNTRTRRRALHRGAGSVGILGACRTGLVVERHPDDPDRRVLAMTKSNLGPAAPSLAFRVREQAAHSVERVYDAGDRSPETRKVLSEPKTFTLQIPAEPVIEWDGPSALTADDLLMTAPEAAGPGPRAAAWLRQVLANGPVAAAEIERLAAAENFGFRTLWATKSRLRIESRRGMAADGKARWEWVLPGEQ